MKNSGNLKGLTTAKIPSIFTADGSAVKGNARQILLTLFSAGLAGCGISPTSTEGVAVKGLLQNAEVFIDTDEDGAWTDGVDSAKVRTDSEGAFSIETELTGDIVVVTDETTVDKSSGEVIAGITMSAPSGSTAVTVATTLTNELMDSDTLTTALTQAEAEVKVKALLGLDESIDVASYNPYAADSIGTDNALAFEKTSQQVMTVINTLAEAESSSTLGADTTKSAAIDNALTAFIAVVEAQIEAPGAPAAPVAIDFTDTALVTDIVAEYDAGSALADANFTASLDAITTAIAQVNTIIDSVTELSTEVDPVFAAAQSTLVDMTQEVATNNDATLSTIDENTTTVETLTSIVEITGTTSGDITDSSKLVVSGADAHTATGTATIEGGDSSLTYAFEVLSASGDHGSFEIDANGVWTYTITDSALNSLSAGTTSESFTVTVNASDDSQSVKKVITIDLVGINDAPYVATEIVDQTADADEVYTLTVDAATVVDVDDSSLTYAATLSDGSALPSWLTFGESNTFRIADSVVTWNDYNPNSATDITYNNSVSIDGNAMTINGSPTLNLTNLTNAASDSGSYKIPSIDIDLLEVPSGSGSGAITFKLVDGSDSTQTGSERYIEMAVQAEWVSSETSFSITLPDQTATGHYITQEDGRVDFSLINVDSDTITVSSGGDLSASPATLSVKLAALIDKLEDVASTSLLQEGDFNLTIATDLPLSDKNGTSITSLETNFSISDTPATTNAFRLADTDVSWKDYDPSSSSDVTYNTTATMTDNEISLNSAPVLNLANLQNAASGTGDFKIPTLNIDLMEIPDGTGSGSITFKLLDGSNDYRSASERYIELSVDVDWSGNGTTASITLPTQSATGQYITPGQGTVDFSIANLDSDTISMSDSGVDYPASINVKLAAIIEKLESVGSISLLQEGDFNLTIETDLPLTDMNGTDITSLTTNFTIAQDPSSVTGDTTSSSHPEITDLTFYGNPTEADVGTYAIEVTATDGTGDTISDTFTLEIV